VLYGAIFHGSEISDILFLQTNPGLDYQIKIQVTMLYEVFESLFDVHHVEEASDHVKFSLIELLSTFIILGNHPMNL
jgi:hypothetical protein